MSRPDLPKLADLPIPADTKVGRSWSPLMAEMADHIGAQAVLLLLDRLGGENIRVSARGTADRLTPIIGAEAAEVFAQTYLGEKIDLPTGHAAIWRAKAAPLIEQVREGYLTIADAARILRVARTRIHALLEEKAPLHGPRRRKRHLPDPRQISMFPATE